MHARVCRESLQSGRACHEPKTPTCRDAKLLKSDSCVFRFQAREMHCRPVLQAAGVRHTAPRASMKMLAAPLPTLDIHRACSSPVCTTSWPWGSLTTGVVRSCAGRTTRYSVHPTGAGSYCLIHDAAFWTGVAPSASRDPQLTPLHFKLHVGTQAFAVEEQARPQPAASWLFPRPAGSTAQSKRQFGTDDASAAAAPPPAQASAAGTPSTPQQPSPTAAAIPAAWSTTLATQLSGLSLGVLPIAAAGAAKATAAPAFSLSLADSTPSMSPPNSSRSDTSASQPPEGAVQKGVLSPAAASPAATPPLNPAAPSFVFGDGGASPGTKSSVLQGGPAVDGQAASVPFSPAAFTPAVMSTQPHLQVERALHFPSCACLPAIVISTSGPVAKSLSCQREWDLQSAGCNCQAVPVWCFAPAWTVCVWRRADANILWAAASCATAVQQLAGCVRSPAAGSDPASGSAASCRRWPGLCWRERRHLRHPRRRRCSRLPAGRFLDACRQRRQPCFRLLINRCHGCCTTRQYRAISPQHGHRPAAFRHPRGPLPTASSRPWLWRKQRQRSCRQQRQQSFRHYRRHSSCVCACLHSRHSSASKA